MNKLPEEFKVIILREFDKNFWDIYEVLQNSWHQKNLRHNVIKDLKVTYHIQLLIFS